MPDQEKRAEQLYEAFMHIVHEQGKLSLLKAVGDAHARVKWNQVYPQTRTIFNMLVEKLTEIEGRG